MSLILTEFKDGVGTLTMNEMAVRHGATHVRVGSALFGVRG